MSAIAHRLIDVPAGRIHVAEQGSGPLVLLVHGFPECWYSWRHQLPAIAEAGYHAVAVDVRGYGRSSKPPALDAYRMLDLAEDIAGVITALGEERRGRRRPRLGVGASPTTTALAPPGCLPRRRDAQRALRTAGRPATHRDLRAHRRAGGVLRRATSRSPAARRPRSSPTSAAGSRASTRRCPASTMPPPDGAGLVTSSPRAGGCATASPTGAAARLAVARTTSTSTRASSSGPA